MKKIIVIDAGHGGTDPGAVANDLQEKDIVLSIAFKVQNLLADLFDVRLTRHDDTFVELDERTALANKWGADCFISIHTNSFANESAHGYEDFSYSGDSKLQRCIHHAVASYWPVDRGMQKSTSLYVLRKTNMSAVLIECGFISNDKNASMIDEAHEREEVAKRIAQGICNYFGVVLEGGADAT